MIEEINNCHSQYLTEFAICEESLKSDNLIGWAEHAKAFLDTMGQCLVMVLSPDMETASEIMKGHRDFRHVFGEHTGMEPRGPRLISLVFQGNGNRLGTLDFRKLCTAYSRLTAISRGKPLSSDQEANVLHQMLTQTLHESNSLVEKWKQEPKDMETVLALCQKAAEEGCKTAKDYLSFIHDVLDESDRLIEKSKQDIAELHLSKSFGKNQASIEDQVSRQLEELRLLFWGTYHECENNILEKTAETAKFNILVFGATMAGKSTLMSILTKGHDEAIGKGGQRTTRDIRQYEWNGLTITDVPGICAVQGQEDTEIADAASAYADMVLFLINSEEPSDEEAEWLVRLKRKDKPILCIINYHESIADEMDRDIFLQNPGYYIHTADMDGIKKQFIEFVHKRLPDEHIDIIVSHFLSRKYADNPAYQDIRERLITASNFKEVEHAIIQAVVKNGVFYRKKCFLSLIDIPLYEQMNGMTSFFRQSKGMHDLSFAKRMEFEKWKGPYLEKIQRKVEDLIIGRFDAVKARIPAFVDEHLESRDFTYELNEFVSGQKIPEKVKEELDVVFQKAAKDVSQFFSDLDKETKFSMKWMSLSEKGTRIHNWKKVVKWGGIALSILTIGVTGGWSVVIGIGIYIIDLISGKMPTKAERKAEKVASYVKSINRDLDKRQAKMIYKTQKDIEKHIKDGLITKATKRFTMLKISIESILEGQRLLVRKYNKCHQEVSKKIIANILESMGYSQDDYQTMEVARIPGKWTVILPGDERIWKYGKEARQFNKEVNNLISTHIGNREKVSIIWLKRDKKLYVQAVHLLKLFFGKGDLFCRINEQYGYMYIDRVLMVEENEDKINIIQQILDLQIISNDKYHED